MSGWQTLTTASDLEEDVEERPFVKVAGSEKGQHEQAYPTVREMYDSRRDA